jgi:hypothetical protein
VEKYSPTSSVEKYSPSSGTWSAVAPLPIARSAHAAVVVGSSMYVLGGWLENVATSTVLKFDSIKGTWSEIAPGLTDLIACAVDRDILVFGQAQGLAYLVKYDTVANTWSAPAPAPIPIIARAHSCSVHILDGLVYIVGAGATRSEVHRFDPVSDAWSVLASLSVPCPFGTSFVLGGSLYKAGGLESKRHVRRYDVATDTWMRVVDTLEDRAGSGAAVTIGLACSVDEQHLFDAPIAKASSKCP